MDNTVFKAYVVEERNGHFTGAVKKRRVGDLPEGELLIRVHYSSLNYKDALSASGNRGVTRRYPHTPGIDASGIVVHSDSTEFQVDDKVIVTGYDLGMDTDGGFGQYIRIPAEWAIRLPGNLSLREAMIFGTAGLTAGTAVSRLINDLEPEDGPIVVSGATGGVGSLGVAILGKLGYHVVAVTGKVTEKDFLVNLGAKEVILRKEFEETDKRPLHTAVYAGAIDTVGGPILEHIIRKTKPFGVVTCCGNIAGANLNLTVYPFILRGISLSGIASQNYPKNDRIWIWDKLAGDWKPEQLESTCEEIGLQALGENIEMMLSGRLTRRKLLNLKIQTL